MKIPFFHYTSLDNLASILDDGRLVSRYWLEKNGRQITDISIDPKQPVRKDLGLLEHVPIFPGFYTLFRSYEFNGYLQKSYDDPKVQNKSFYGTLNRVLQAKMGEEYENVIILLVRNDLVYELADQQSVRFFSDIAVKPEADESPVTCRADLDKLLKESIDNSNISGEIDLFDDGKTSIACMSDIEAIIVDSEKMKGKVIATLNKRNKPKQRARIFISELPRNDPGLTD